MSFARTEWTFSRFLWLTATLDLSAAVDVYSEWVDACDAVAQGTTEGDGGEQAPARAQAKPGQGRQRQEEEEENDDDRDLIDDTDDHIGYGGDGIDDY